ncbi:DMT family transporter [Actinokineospora soli]|uniref:DMT family transporter n=1 Tax=Actinokineospora soli TaxID=1048753 RepID=A0ABW2TWF2_9PSEU
MGAGFAGGAAVAVQTRINGQLAGGFGDGFVAALVSFGIGLVLLVPVVLTAGNARAAGGRVVRALRDGELRWWQCLGGAGGAWFVTTQGLTASVLGVAVFTVSVVAGQVVTSLFVDRAGIGPGGPVAITRGRALGAALAVVAVGIAVSDDVGRPDALWPALIPALGGAAMGWQQAVNGLVRVRGGSVRFATMLNFAVGTVLLFVVCAVKVAVWGWPNPAPTEWWLYTGGAIGIVALTTAVFAVKHIGVLVLGLSAVSGQLVGSILVDLTGPGVDGATVAGAAVTLVAVVVAAGRRPAMRG